MAVICGVIHVAVVGFLTMAYVWGAPPHIEPDARRPEIEALYEEALFALDAGDADRARALLQTVLEHQPDHAGAWLDLALLQCRAGDRRGGKAILDHVQAAYTPPPAIRALIEELAATACAPARQWRLQSGFALGHDDNVNLGVGQAYTRLMTEAGVLDVLLGPSMQARADSFAELWVELGRTGLPFRFSAVLRHHAQDSEFDSHQFSLEGWRTWTNARVQTLVRGHYTHTGLGGRPFLDTLGLEVGRHRLGCSVCPSAQIRLGLQRFPEYGAYDAAVGELRLGLRFEGESRALRVWTSVQGDHALAARPGGDRYGGGVEFEGLMQLGPRLLLQARTGLNFLRDTLPYSEPLLPWQRHRRLQSYRVELHTPLNRGFTGFAGWYRSASNGNLDFLDFRSDSIRVGLNWAGH